MEKEFLIKIKGKFVKIAKKLLNNLTLGEEELKRTRNLFEN